MPVTHVPVSVADAATYTVLAQNSGLVHYLPDLTADIVITLPAPKAGLWFEFIYTGAAADAQDWLFDTGSDTNYYKGGVLFVDTDAGDAADEASVVRSDGNSNSKFSVQTPDCGTRVRIECADGTHWNLQGVISSTTAPTMADQ